jgi:O-antigen/teichoic acid export membrane protein
VTVPAREPDGSPPSGAVARGSVARFFGEAAGAAFGLLIGAMTARYLGPAGKGTLSALTYLVALAAPACALGLGEASQALVGQGRTTLQRCVPAVAGVLICTTSVGMLLFIGLSVALFPGEVPGLRVAIVAAAVTLPLIVFVTAFGALLESAGQVVFVSLVRAGIAAATALATYLLVYQLDRAITGALLAIGVGWAAGLCVLIGRMVSLGVTPLPRRNVALVRTAVPLGIPTALSYLVIVASTRIDLLFVRVLAGAADAGQYSIALTVGQLATYAPVALSVAAFPTVARLSPEEARPFVARLCRATVAGALLSALLLAVTVPILIPLAFGFRFRPAVEPALILLVAGIAWGAQWTACRSEAARGRPGVLLVSFTVSLFAMVAGDLLLIPPYGVQGAAVAALISSLAGLGVVLGRRHVDSVTPPLRGFVPTVDDLAYVRQVVGELLGQRRRS